MTAQAFVNAARGFVGRRAKWQHQGRHRDAVDCVGLLVLSAKEAGYSASPLAQPPKYARTPWDGLLERSLEAEFGEPVTDWQPGDVALVRWGKGEAGHIAIIADYLYGGLSVIHAESRNKRVLETRLAGKVLGAIEKVYRPKWPDSASEES